MRSILRLTTHLYLVLAVLACVPAGAGQVVLCVAPSGHVAIEVGAGRCVDAPPAAAQASTSDEIVLLPDNCDDCVDVPVGAHVLRASPRGNSTPSPQVVASHPLAADDRITELFGATRLSTVVHGTLAPESFAPARTAILRN